MITPEKSAQVGSETLLTPAKGCNPKVYLNGTHLHLVARSNTNDKFPDTFESLRSLHFFGRGK